MRRRGENFYEALMDVRKREHAFLLLKRSIQNQTKQKHLWPPPFNRMLLHGDTVKYFQICTPPFPFLSYLHMNKYSRSHQYSCVLVDYIGGVSVPRRAHWLVVLVPGVCSRRDALLVPTAQLHHWACHCWTGDFTGRGVWGHWRTIQRENYTTEAFWSYFFPRCWLSVSLTQDFEGDISLAQIYRIIRSADLTTVLPSILLGHPFQCHCRPCNGRPTFKGTWERERGDRKP